MSGQESVVTFHINGKKFKVRPGESGNSYPHSRLVGFIRREAGLRGTKYTCREGGCGACVVVARSRDPVTGNQIIRAINSCLMLVYSCDGFDITTVERLGNDKEGYDVIQRRLVAFSGTQCGFCTPGFVMNMHGLLRNNPRSTSKEIEDAFDGNICRCTGYRPILDAFKSLAVDASESIKQKCAAYEATIGKSCPLKAACVSANECLKSSSSGDSTSTDIEDCCKNSILNVKVNDQHWNKPFTLAGALALVKQYVSDGVSYRLVAGNTSTGIFKNEGPFTAYVDLTGIAELRQYSVTVEGVAFGGGVTLGVAIEQLKSASEIPGYEYAAALARHWGRVANVPVRNAGTIAGNLMIKHAHRDFPSDIFLTLHTLKATVRIASMNSTHSKVFKIGKEGPKVYTIEQFLNFDMTGRIIVSIQLPALPRSEGYLFRSYKITKRYQNAHAYVNSAMLFKLDSNLTVTEVPRICFGGINPMFVNAVNTETYLAGKSLSDNAIVLAAIDVLEGELNPDNRPPDASPEYRKALARNLLYKTILGIVDPSNSGGLDLERNLTSGQQSYDYNEDEFPLTQPIPKLEAVYQVSGAAEYVNDIPSAPGELYGVYVFSTVANAELNSLDPTDALAIPRVIAFVSARDIPGENNYSGLLGTYEPIFVEREVKAAGAPLGLILAETRDAALEAVTKVKVTYTNIQRPVLSIRDALALAEQEGYLDEVFLPPVKGDESNFRPQYKVSGQFDMGGQYHFQMETQVAICIPKEGSYDIYSATQFMDLVQVAVAEMLGIQGSRVNVQVRRLGGGYGSKIARATLVACGAALGSYVTNRPVRLVMDLESNMHMIGKRPKYLGTYDVGFDSTGKIHSLKARFISECGSYPSDAETMYGVPSIQSVYDCTGWEVVAGTVQTNVVSNTWCRAPATTNGVALIEMIMERIAHTLKKDPLEVRLANLLQEGGTTLGLPGGANGSLNGENFIPRMLDELKRSSSYDARKKAVEQFNNVNRWRKQGLSMVPLRYPHNTWFARFPCYVAIYAHDGSVAISHGGIEMGQGLFTKAAVTVAYALGIPLDKVVVKPSDNLISANGPVTGGSKGSELVPYAALRACEILKERMAPVKEELGADVPWEQLVAECNNRGIDLRATFMPIGTAADPNLKEYNVWGLTLTEVEVDMLTGEFKIVRVDLIEDAGKSMSPEIDIGQVEGAFVMGLGLWVLEKLEYDENTGQLLTHNTWEYKIPFAKDIPEDFRVTLLHNAPNPDGILGSKVTGEPPTNMSIGVVFALKNAIDSARQDAGNTNYYQINTPLTPENILQLSLTSTGDFQLDRKRI